jgi:tetratricopeptide (TPR) repeat protein
MNRLHPLGRAVTVAALVASSACPRRPAVEAPETPTLAGELSRAEARVQAGDDSAAAWRELGLLRWFGGEPDPALAALGEARRRDPTDARALFALAQLLDARLDPTAATVYAELVAAAEQAPADPWARAGSAIAIDWLDQRATFEGDSAAAKVVAAARTSKVPALAAQALATRRYRNRGDAAAEVPAWRAERGLVPAWVMHSRADVMPHARLYAPPGAGPAPAVGDGTRLDAPLGRALVRPPRREPALVRLDTMLTADARREVELELWIGDPDGATRVWLGDVLVLGRESSRRFLPRRLSSLVTLAPGQTPLTIELATLGQSVAVEIVVRDPQTGRAPVDVRFAADPLAPGAGARAAKAVFRGASPKAVPPARSFADGLVADLLLFHAAVDRVDADAGAEVAARLAAAAPRWAVGHELEALAARLMPAAPRVLAKDAARLALTRALALDPAGLRARIDLAEQLLNDDDPTGALGALGEGEKATPGGAPIRHPRAELVRAEALFARGREGEAEAALGRALAAAPGSCDALGHAFRLARQKGELERAQALAEAAVACDGWSAALAVVRADAGDLAGALAERQRLAARDPQDPGGWLDVARAQLALDQPGAARATLTAALELDAEDRDVRIALADVLAAGGDVAAARARLAEGLALAPVDRRLHHTLVALGGADPLERFRIDGRAVIRAFEADEKAGRRPPYTTPAVIVLDRTVDVIHAGGERTSLTHNIVKVLEKDGLDRWGELPVPEGAEVLVARTIKADGRIREPQAVGKDGLTAPDLAVGDYVEFEYVLGEARAAAWAGGVIGPRFFFSSADAPLDRTELVVVAPADYPLELDRRGDAPTPQVERQGGQVVTTFALRGRAQLHPEPGSPPGDEWISSVRVFAKVTLGAWRDWVGGQVYGARRGDRDLRATALQLVAGKKGRAALQALYDFVLDEVDDGGPLTDEPATILARRQGRRQVLLLALCDAAGLDAELWMARPRGAGVGTPPPVELPELGYPLVRVRLPGGDVFVDTRVRFAPLGYLAPSLRGVPMLEIPDPARGPAGPAKLVLSPTGARADDPEVVEGGDARIVDLSVDLAADGSATIVAREVLTGQPAAIWRDFLKDTSREEIEKTVEEALIGFYFPGGALTALGVEGSEDPAVPLRVTYRFTAPRLARPGPGGGLVVPAAFMPVSLGKRYVLVGQRQTPLVLGDDGAMSVTTTIHAPGLVARGVPARLQMTAPGGVVRYVLDCSAGDGTGGGGEDTGVALRCASALQVEPLGRVAPGDYADFTQVAGAVDAAEAATITLVPSR